MSAKVLPFPTRPSRLSLLLDRFASDRSVLLAIFALYFAMRVAVLFIDVMPSSDAAWYHLRAASLAAGDGYLDNSGEPTAFWPPGWPIALSIAYAQFGVSQVTLGLFNLASAMAIGGLTLALGRRILGSEGGARAALLLLAVYPNAIGYVPLALTEVFYTALLLAGCWLLITRTNRWQLISAGLIFGFATLVKAQSLVVIPLVFAIDWFRRDGLWRHFPRLLGEGLLVLAIALLTVTPWTLRNHAQLGEIVAVSTNGGFTLLTGNNERADGGYTPDAPRVEAVMARPGLDEVERDTLARESAVEWITQNPEDFLALLPKKLMRLWLPDGEAQWAYETGVEGYESLAPLYDAVRWINQAYYFVLLAAFLVAFFLLLARRRADGQRWVGWWLLPYAIALYPTVIALAFSGQSRFHYPVMPFVCMTAGWLAFTLAGRWAERPGARMATVH